MLGGGLVNRVAYVSFVLSMSFLALLTHGWV